MANDPSGQPLAEEQRAAVDRWYASHGPEVVREVRRHLRRSTEFRTAASVSALAQSVWDSFMRNHLDEVDPTNSDGPWAVLAMAARRHCEKWNRRGTRHPQAPLDSAPSDPADHRVPPPEFEAMVRECRELFKLPNGAIGEAVGTAVVRVEPSGGFVRCLKPEERDIFSLKLADYTTQQIANQLGIDETDVRHYWTAVRRKAQEFVVV